MKDSDVAALTALELADPDQLRAYFEQAARQYAAGAWARSTLRQYASQWRMFEAWCERTNNQALPATPECLAAFVAYEVQRTTVRGAARRMAGVRQALSAIRFTHRLKGQHAPIDHPYVNAVLRGRANQVKALPVERAEAVRVQDLVMMVGAMRHTELRAVHDRALLTLGFAGALRRGELVGLTWSHVRELSGSLVITIPSPKARPEDADQVLAPAATRHSGLCPVAAVLAWHRLSERTGLVFRRFAGQSPTGPLREADVAEVLNRRASAAGLDVGYTGHSLRNGWATAAGEAGVPLVAIQHHLRHQDVRTSARYVQAGQWAQHPGMGLY